MRNICEIFTNNSDKAHLITAVISVIAAVLVVFLTHILASHRGKIELKTKKLEDCYSALSIYTDAGYRLIHDQTGHSDIPVDVSSSSKYSEAHNKLEMLSAIYLPEIEKFIFEMHLIVLFTKEFQDSDVTHFQENLKKFVEFNSAAQRVIVRKIQRNI